MFNKRMKLKPADKRRTTTVTFTAEDLAALVRLIGVGQVLLQTTSPVIGRVKAAMTRVGAPKTIGL